MLPAVRPLWSLSMARGYTRIDSRPTAAKIGSAGRVEAHRAPGCVGDEKRFHTAWVKLGSGPVRGACPFYPQEQTSSGRPGMSERCQQATSRVHSSGQFSE